MKLKNYFLLCLIAIPAAIMASEKSGAVAMSSTSVKTDTDVYVAGNIQLNGKSVAAYWKNGVCTKLSDGKLDCYTTGIAVHGSKVYVTGNCFATNSSRSLPAYWVNGVETRLTDGTFDAFASGIAVNAAGDVYVAGYIMDHLNTNQRAVYWKNGGKAIELAPGVSSDATAVAINETGVYFSGNITTAGRIKAAVYWKDGVLTNLGDGITPSLAYAITLNGATVYTLGTVISVSPTINYWRNNGKAIAITDGSVYATPLGIAVNGSNVYVVGDVNGNTAACWKNGTITKLVNDPKIFSHAKGLALAGDNVYVAGFTTDIKVNDAGVYWQNGVLKHLANAVDASAIVVVTHKH